jgi:hypothetical protein
MTRLPLAIAIAIALLNACSVPLPAMKPSGGAPPPPAAPTPPAPPTTAPTPSPRPPNPELSSAPPIAPAPPAAPPKAPAKESAPSKPAPKPPTPPPVAVAKPAPAPAPVAAPATAPLDLKSLEQRLRDTKAIGTLTKLSLKNQVDDLIDRFRDFHAGNHPPTLADLRPAFDLLLMKVLSLLQDNDPALARDINASRDTIWGVLADRQKLTQFIQG